MREKELRCQKMTYLRCRWLSLTAKETTKRWLASHSKRKLRRVLSSCHDGGSKVKGWWIRDQSWKHGSDDPKKSVLWVVWISQDNLSLTKHSGWLWSRKENTPICVFKSHNLWKADILFLIKFIISSNSIF